MRKIDGQWIKPEAVETGSTPASPACTRPGCRTNTKRVCDDFCRKCNEELRTHSSAAEREAHNFRGVGSNPTGSTKAPVAESADAGK